MGCHLTVNVDEKKVTGNSCKRGEIYGLNDDLDESVKYKKAKHINESFTMEHELQSVLRKFRIFIDMDRVGEIAYDEELDELDPSLQRIIS